MCVADRHAGTRTIQGSEGRGGWDAAFQGPTVCGVGGGGGVGGQSRDSKRLELEIRG